MKTFLTLAAAALISIGNVNLAQAEDEAAASLTVQFADLDLDKPQGAATLFTRIKTAAERVCSDHRGPAPADTVRYKACVRVAVSNAVAKVDRPTLTDYVASQSVKVEKQPEQLASKR